MAGLHQSRDALLLVDWPSRARDAVALFRIDYGRHAGDLHFVQLIEKLRSVSPEFSQWWPRHDVLPLGEGRLLYNHPAVGRLYLEHVGLALRDNPELTLVMFVPVPELDSIAKLGQIIKSFKGSTGRSVERVCFFRSAGLRAGSFRGVTQGRPDKRPPLAGCDAVVSSLGEEGTGAEAGAIAETGAMAPILLALCAQRAAKAFSISPASLMSLSDTPPSVWVLQMNVTRV